MRRGFEGTLRDYGEIAKDDSAARRARREAKDQRGFETAQTEVDRLEDVAAWHLERRARFADTGADAQREVFDLQKRKQEIMTRLQAGIAALDAAPEAGEWTPREGARAVMARENGELFCRRRDGAEIDVTLGEIVTDGEWGTAYDADPASVPRVTRKRLLVEQAKQEISDLLDEQIMTEEIASGRVHTGLKEAYAAVRERRETGALPHGIIAEKMTAQLVRKQIMDEDAPYRFDPGDVFQDVVRKIDFVIRRSDYGRGVRVEDAPDLEAKAVQLTINRDAQALERKRSQIAKTREHLDESDHIDDIALVRFEQRVIVDAFKAWEAANRPPGGPDKFLPPDLKARMFQELVAGME